VVDVHDAEALRAVLPEGGTLFALNPPADPTDGNTDAEERATGDAIVAAIRGARLERVVALSTYGAEAGERIGDLGTLHRFEEGLADLETPVAVVRAAYLLSHWDGLLPPDLLTRDAPATGIHFVEGPERYTPADVAAAFGSALGRPVEVTVTPPDGWAPPSGRWGSPPRRRRRTRA
jgi:uncharacterized protein YbjT (DUF2867 family)